jgi:predicted transcriptional regulator
MNNEYASLAREYHQFETVEALNESVSQHVYQHKFDLSKSAEVVLQLLSKYAVKFRGVAFLKFATIMEKTELSRSTVIRAVKQLVDLGIIAKHHMMRSKSGGNGANLYVINSFDPIETPVQIQEETPVPTNNETPVSSSDDTPVDTPEMELRGEQENPVGTDLEALLQKTEAFISKANSEKEYVNNNLRIESVYDRFKKLFVKFSKDNELLYKCYGVYLANVKWLKDSYSEEELLDTALYSIKTTFQYSKKRRVKNFAGLFHTVLNGALDRLYESYALEWA